MQENACQDSCITRDLRRTHGTNQRKCSQESTMAVQQAKSDKIVFTGMIIMMAKLNANFKGAVETSNQTIVWTTATTECQTRDVLDSDDSEDVTQCSHASCQSSKANRRKLRGRRTAPPIGEPADISTPAQCKFTCFAARITAQVKTPTPEMAGSTASLPTRTLPRATTRAPDDTRESQFPYHSRRV